MTLAAKLRLLSGVARSNPQEFQDRLFAYLSARSDRWRTKPDLSTALSPTECQAALAAAIGSDMQPPPVESELRALASLVEGRLRDVSGTGPFASFHNSDPSLARFCYFACRIVKPNHIVTTGVAYGVTEAFLLEALARNGRGRLWSIDLPPLAEHGDSFVGYAIPDEARARWTLTRGSSRRVLPGLLRTIGKIDLFVHDSLHTYSNMMRELETVWPCLTPGGLVIADDIEGNCAFSDFCRQAKPRFVWTVQEESKRSVFGVMVKAQ